jgi:hypothetical protein
MSCPGDNYVVPGANPCNDGGGGGGVQSVVAGTNVTISGTSTNPQVNASGVVQAVVGGNGIIVSGAVETPTISISGPVQTQAFGNNTISIANLTSLTQNISSVGFTTTGVSDVYASVTITVTTTSNTKYDNLFSLTIDGAIMSSGVFPDTIDGIGHFRTVTIVGFRANLAAGSHTLRATGSTNAPTNTISVTRITTTGLANLL